MNVLVVDDAPDVVESIRLNFLVLWKDVLITEASTGTSALVLVHAASPDMVLLDIGLPDMDGFEVLQQIRKSSDVPVIMLTARDHTAQKVRALQLGADDYVTKPFHHTELIERVRAVLRRLEMPRRRGLSFRTGEFEMDFASQEVLFRGERVSLTATEYKLLQHLVRNAGKVQLSDQILKDVWGPEYQDEFVYLRVYVRRLREKLGDDSEHPRYIHTERGRGYRFAEPDGVVIAGA